MNFLRCLWAVCTKDLLSELRKRATINSILFFSLLIIFLFSFAIGAEPDLLKRMAPGLLWMVILFSSILTLERSFQIEIEQGCLDGLLLYANNYRAVFLGKLVTNLIFIMLVQCLVMLMMILLYGLAAPKNPGLLVLVFFLGDLGVATLGTFYAALTAKTRASQVLLPLLLFPMLTPLLLGAVYVTQFALEGDLFHQTDIWLKLLIIFDTIFVAACLMAADPLLEA